MDKLYYQDIHWYDYLIYLAYNIIISFLILKISDAGFSFNKKARFAVLLQFQLLFFLVVLDTQFNFLHATAGSDIFSNMIQSGQYPKESKENILPFYYLSIFINMICLNSVAIFLFISFFILSIAMMYFSASVRLLFPGQNEKAVGVFLLINLFYPGIYLFFTSPSRDAYVLLAFSLFIQALVKYRSNQKLIPVVTWGVVLSLLEFYFAPFFLIVLVYLWFIKQSFSRRIYSGMIFLLLLIVSLFVLNQQGISSTKLSDFRNINLFNTGNFGYGEVHWSNYFELLRDECLLAAQFLFSPLPVFSGYPLLGNIPLLIDLVFVCLCLLIFLYLIKKIIPRSGWLVFILVLFIFYFGSVENDLEAAARHRIPGIELILLLISGFIIQRSKDS